MAEFAETLPLGLLLDVNIISPTGSQYYHAPSSDSSLGFVGPYPCLGAFTDLVEIWARLPES